MIHWLLHTYWPEVRGNVYAVLPCGLVAYLWLRAKHLERMAAHASHDEKLEKILAHLDPEAETDGLLDLIADRTDETTPGGIGAVLTALDSQWHNPTTGGDT